MTFAGDFLINRKFRQSLLCRDTIAPARAPQPESLARLYVAVPHRGKQAAALFVFSVAP